MQAFTAYAQILFHYLHLACFVGFVLPAHVFPSQWLPDIIHLWVLIHRPSFIYISLFHLCQGMIVWTSFTPLSPHHFCVFPFLYPSLDLLKLLIKVGCCVVWFWFGIASQQTQLFKKTTVAWSFKLLYVNWFLWAVNSCFCC